MDIGLLISKSYGLALQSRPPYSTGQLDDLGGGLSCSEMKYADLTPKEGYTQGFVSSLNPLIDADWFDPETSIPAVFLFLGR